MYQIVGTHLNRMSNIVLLKQPIGRISKTAKKMHRLSLQGQRLLTLTRYWPACWNLVNLSSISRDYLEQTNNSLIIILVQMYLGGFFLLYIEIIKTYITFYWSWNHIIDICSDLDYKNTSLTVRTITKR